MSDRESWIREELAKLAQRVDATIASQEPYIRDPELDELFMKSQAHKMTPHEYKEQRINWVWGQCVDLPEELRPTLDEVRQYLKNPHAR